MDKLKGQREKLKDKNMDLDVWFSATLAHLQTALKGRKMTLIANFIELHTNYKNAPLFNDKLPQDIDNIYREKAKQFLNEVIEIIEKTKINKTQIVNKTKKNKTLFKYTNNNYVINQLLFWTVLSIIVTGVFSLGFYFGNNKFDKDKFEYYQNMKRLENELVLKDSL